MRPSAPSIERWMRIEEVFGHAVALAEPERARYVAAACGDDVALREEVAALLAGAGDGARLVDEIVANGMGAFAGHGATRLVGSCIGPYRIVSLVDEGGMGAVYLAERDDAEFRRHVAIKVLRHGLGSRDAIARFRDERQILADLDHPGIVRLIDGGTHDGLPYLVMEKVDGLPITVHADVRELSTRDRIALVRRVCDALAYAHRKHVVHRDIKPSNLLVTDDGTPKLLDFGIAKLLDSSDREARTRTGVMLMTPEYASPEQASGEPVTVATDIYSLGAVLYELLTGRPPLQPRGGPLAIIKAIAEDDPPPPSISRELDAIIMKALHKQPARRYATIDEFRQDLGRFLDGVPVSARSPSWLRFAKRASVRKRVRLAGVLGVAACAAAGSFIALRRSDNAAAGSRTMQRLTSQLGSLSGARFAPDGRTIVYSGRWGNAPRTIFTLVPGEAPRTLRTDADLLAVSPDGELAVLVKARVASRTAGQKPLLTGTLARMRMDGGALADLATDVVAADWADDRQLAITRYIPGISTNGTGSRGIVEWPIGSSVYEVEGKILTTVRVSPDGERVAFLEGHLARQIVVVDRAKAVTRVGVEHDIAGFAWHSDDELWVADTLDASERCVHAMSLDGARRLVQCGTGSLALHDVDRSGRVLVTSTRTDSRIRVKAPGTTEERDVQWNMSDVLYDVTPDGRRIVFGPGGFDGPLYIRDLGREDSAPVRVGTGFGMGISPDGAWIATTRNEPDRGLRYYFTPTGPGVERERTAPSMTRLASTMGGWSPDGRVLYNACSAPEVATCAFTPGGDGRVVIRGKRPASSNSMRSISPDGKWMLGTDGATTLELVATDGSTSRPLPDTPATRNLGHHGFGIAVGWTSDGRAVFVQGGVTRSGGIERLDLETGAATPWKKIGPEDTSGDVTLTSLFVIAGGEGHAYSFTRAFADLYLLSP